ncbi:MAG: porin [Chitinophagaceae bacterium]|jgi:phosphate-selective porin OprO/OprP|nr:porin [Chitinophagaceae bacterium]
MKISSPIFLAASFLAMSLFLSSEGWCQERDSIPDGTQGEMLEVVTSDSSRMQWKDKRWRLFNGRFTTFKFGGAVLYEYAAFAQDENSQKQMDSLGTPLADQFKFRDVRVYMSGQLKTKRTISWKAGFMYDGPSNSWFVRETGVMVGVPEISSSFFVGRTKEGYSLNKVMNGYAGWGLERQMAIDMIPILADGIKWLGYLPKQRIFWNTGIFTDWLSKDESFSTYRWQFITRAGWLPILSPSTNTVLHIGFNYRYGKVAGGEMQLRSRPETNPAPYFISTGKFQSEHSNHVGYEVYYKAGAFLAGSEYHWHKFNAPAYGNPLFKGGELMVSYLFTGESRPYHTSTSILGFVPIKKSVFKGGLGAIEGVLRFTQFDLDGGNIQGGKFWRITPMVNWYMSKDIRLEFAYGYGVLDRFNIKGGTQFFQARIQVALL